MLRKIAVLGGGNGAHAMAADLTLKGLEVNICEAPEFKENFSTTLERQEICLIDAWGEEKTVKPAMVTTDFERAIKGVDYIMIAVPAIGHKHFFTSIMPHLEDGQTIVMWPGNYSALLFTNMLGERGIKRDITLAEGHTLPWGCRLEARGTVKIFVDAWKLQVAAFPAKNTGRVINDLKDVYPVVPGENVLATSLNNLNPIVHPAGAVLNAGWVDTLGRDFYFYKLGTTLSVARAIKAVYEEVARVGEAIGIKLLEYPEETFWSKSTIMSFYFKAPFDIEGTVANISGPSSMKSRYITEDVPYGLVPTAQLAHKFKVDIPIADAIIRLASVVNQTDYYKEGRSLEELGIADMSKQELAKILQEGF
ncbi:MAG: NAD/NADP octopine/nopaline dehydrogenase family protein [Dehalococcoidia bacterium]|nr:NAD/NADP octopine/nopaline dehydrogenase family protein [Dehalococcoidia bacterium]